VPLAYTEEFAAKYAAQGSKFLNPMQYLFEAEGMLAEREGRLPAAVNSYLDWLRAGVKGLRGGLLAHRFTGQVCQSEALRRLQRLESWLGAAECRQAIRGLEQAAADEEPIEAVVERDKAWWRTWSSWSERAFVRVWYGDVYSAYYEPPRRHVVARHRLLVADLAVLAYQLEKGTQPLALADLVPEYLSSIPEDPFSGKPLLYRAAGRGYRLYSVGPDGRDDGGLLVPPKDLETGSDYFLETDLLPAPTDP